MKGNVSKKKNGSDFTESNERLEDLIKETECIRNETANSLRETVKGEIIRIDDVSPIEHRIKVKLKNKNIVPTFTETKTAIAVSGLTYSCEENGASIVINGESGSFSGGRNTLMPYTRPMILEKGKTYTLMHEVIAGTTTNDYVVSITKRADTSKNLIWRSNNNNITFTVNETADYFVGINVYQNTTFDNCAIRISIEEGTSVTEYTPWVDLNTVNVFKTKKNICGITASTKTRNGITVVSTGDGNITITGTPIDASSITYIGIPPTDDNIRLLKNCTYAYSPDSYNKYDSPGVKAYIETKTMEGVWHGAFQETLIKPTQDVYITQIIVAIKAGVTDAINENLFMSIEKGSEFTGNETASIETYTPDTAAAVDITSLSPTMTVFTDKPGVKIEMEYNQDTNTVIEKLDNHAKESANSLKNNAEGELIRVDDVSPLKHAVKAEISSKNLLPPRKINGTYTEAKNGITLTQDADGTITVNGTATAKTVFTLGTKIPMIIEGVTYTFSHDTGYDKPQHAAIYYAKKDGELIYTWTIGKLVSGRSAYTAAALNSTTISYVISFESGDIINNEIYKLQFEIGDTASSYTPCYVDLKSIGINTYSKNLLPPRKINGTYTETKNGITLTQDADGTITVNGTATAKTVFTLGTKIPMIIEGVTYTFSHDTGYDKPQNAQIYYAKKDGELIYTWTIGKRVSDRSAYTAAALNSTTISYVLIFESGDIINNEIYKLQFEAGSAATEYAPYSLPTVFIPDSEGIVDIVSMSPAMTVFADKPGIKIEMEYNQDSNKIIKKMQEDIQSIISALSEMLGGEASTIPLLYEDEAALPEDFDVETATEDMEINTAVIPEAADADATAEAAVIEADTEAADEAAVVERISEAALADAQPEANDIFTENQI